MKNSGQGIVKDKRGQEQPADRKRARTVHKTKTEMSVSREGTRNPRLNDSSKTPGSGTMADDEGDGSAG